MVTLASESALAHYPTNGPWETGSVSILGSDFNWKCTLTLELLFVYFFASH